MEAATRKKKKEVAMDDACLTPASRRVVWSLNRYPTLSAVLC